MTSGEVRTLVRNKTRNKARVHVLEERQGDLVAFLCYSIDDQNQMTMWHTGVPPSMQHKGVGGRLVKKTLDLAQENSMKLRIVCPFAKDYLARHPELKERYSALSEAALESESLFGSVKADGS